MFQVGKVYLLRSLNKLTKQQTNIEVEVTSCEDRGLFWYVGYHRLGVQNNLQHGYCRIYKDINRPNQLNLIRELIDIYPEVEK